MQYQMCNSRCEDSCFSRAWTGKDLEWDIGGMLNGCGCSESIIPKDMGHYVPTVQLCRIQIM